MGHQSDLFTLWAQLRLLHLSVSRDGPATSIAILDALPTSTISFQADLIPDYFPSISCPIQQGLLVVLSRSPLVTNSRLRSLLRIQPQNFQEYFSSRSFGSVHILPVATAPSFNVNVFHRNYSWPLESLGVSFWGMYFRFRQVIYHSPFFFSWLSKDLFTAWTRFPTRFWIWTVVHFCMFPNSI